MLGNHELEDQDFAEWNQRAQGLMRIWEIAELVGLAPCLERRLEEFPHSEMAACLARRGNSRETYLRLFLLSLRALLAEGPHSVGSLPESVREEQILSTLDVALVGGTAPFWRLLSDSPESEGRPLSSAIPGGTSARKSAASGNGLR